MRIEKVEKSKKVHFRNLKVGDCYLDSNNKLCMKISSIYNDSGDDYDCVCLETGDVDTGYSEVIPVEVIAQYYEK